MNIHRLWRWIIEIWRWIAEGKIIFMFLLVIFTAFALGFLTWRTEVSIRSAGYVLQFIGMIFAIRGLLGIREHFGQPLLREMFLNWLKRFPRWKRNVVPVFGHTKLGIRSMPARFGNWAPDNTDQPIEKRIERIVQNLEKIRVEQREHANSIDVLQTCYDEHKKEVTEQVQNMEDNIRSDLEALHTSDLITSLVGLVWLTIGITMSTMAKELVQWLK